MLEGVTSCELVAQSLGLAAATVGLVVASLLPATPAFAVDGEISTEVSGPGGFGRASAEPNTRKRTVTLTACDLGNPDGLRAVAIMWFKGVRYEVHDANGANLDCVSRTINNSAFTSGQYTLQACLRNGSAGANVYCSPKIYPVL
jgi:hypothetical protein